MTHVKSEQAKRLKKEYRNGYNDGYADCETLLQPINTNGHTRNFYLAAKAKYETAIYTFNPTEYQKGYAQGFDDRAENKRPAIANDFAYQL